MLFKYLIIISSSYLFSAVSYAAYEETLLKDDLIIKAKGQYILKMPAKEKTNIIWRVIDKKDWKTECITATQLNTEHTFPITSWSAQTKYTPSKDGFIEIEFKNNVDHPIKLNITSFKLICDSMACDYLKRLGIKEPIEYTSSDTPYFKRVRISKFTKIVTSKDKSWSRISGITEYGENFKADFIWWKFDPEKELGCGNFIKRYKEKTDKSKTSVMISGPILYNKKLDNLPVFYRVEGCTGKPLDMPRDKYDL